jgi:hypothetical protein
MKHENPDTMKIAAEAVVSPDAPARLARRERIERWAAALEKHRGPLAALRQIEYLSPEMRRAYRDANSPLTVAYQDPVLRDDGLDSDRLGEVMDYFEMTNEDAHRLLCDCHYHGTMTGSGLAARLRHFANRSERGSLWDRAQAVFMNRH